MSTSKDGNITDFFHLIKHLSASNKKIRVKNTDFRSSEARD